MSALWELLEYSLLGLFGGGVLALIAVSFVLIYKGTHAVNFAVGEIMMLGAYLYYAGRVTFGLPGVAAFLVAVIGVAAVSVLIERLVLRPLAGQPVIAVLMATIGLSSIIHGTVEGVWGGDTLDVPALLPRLPLSFGEVMIPGAAVGNFALAAAIIAAFMAFFRYSKTGVALRATASDPITAATMGIDIRHAQRLTWILSGIVGAVAGVLIATAGGLSPGLAGSALAVFAVIILGGMDSLLGAIVASLVIGWLESVVVGYVGGKARDVLPYLVVLAILVVRPYGLFGSRDIERL
jgi:branched-chain amino acid transport system permease protein